MSYKVHVKNMVCPRCISAVSNMLQELKVPYSSIKLGEVELTKSLGEENKNKFSIELQKAGFSLINDRKSQLIEQMKTLVIDKIHHSPDDLNIKWADLISENLHLDYKYLSSLFSSVESITFEQFIINQKIERVKELLVYNELELKEIAYQLNYSSVSYLSNQFKKITGMTPSQFKKSAIQNRKSLDDVY